MAEHVPKRQRSQKKTATKKAVGKGGARKVLKQAVAPPDEQRGARIVVLTDDPRRNVVIVPGCHLDSMPQQRNVYFFEDGNALVGMIVTGGTVEYSAADRTYVVRLTNGMHTAE